MKGYFLLYLQVLNLKDMKSRIIFLASVAFILLNTSCSPRVQPTDESTNNSGESYSNTLKKASEDRAKKRRQQIQRENAEKEAKRQQDAKKALIKRSNMN